MAWGRQNSNISYAPTNQLNQTVAAGSHERVKWHLLDLQFDMERCMSEFMAHQNYGATQALLAEHLHASILTFFECCRPHIIGFFVKEEIRIAKAKQVNLKARRAEHLRDLRTTFSTLDQIFDEVYNQRKLTAQGLKSAHRFLTQFLWDIGISNVERPDRDPVSEFSIAAYGEDFSEPEDEGGED